ncbi:hypothetical protein [Kitasatospora sp. MBT63]|uniref:hypothetical protein n=1 Tax=Kitasatospora sp. MBT63 TaxID=1444768 RepID=UPI00053AC902|nr:hypothetical protein [Kitasatospora sp. MBT63]
MTAQAGPHPTGGATVTNTVSGGIFLNTVVQGRNLTVQLPAEIAAALSGLPASSTAFTGRDDQVETPGPSRAAAVRGRALRDPDGR